MNYTSDEIARALGAIEHPPDTRRERTRVLNFLKITTERLLRDWLEMHEKLKAMVDANDR